MTRLNRVTVDARTGVATVQAGATWADVQAKIAPVGGAVKIMQTSNVFTVGGSVSVNCHGRTPGLPPVAHSVRSLTLVGPDGGIRRCSREEDRTLFRHVIGGYGLFGVLVEIELDTVPDSLCAMEVGLIGEVDLAAEFEASVRDPEIEMAYGRVSPALDGQVLFHRVRRVAPGDAPAGTEGNIEGGGMAPLVKLTMEASRRFPDFMETRWWIEKQMKGERSLANRNAFMSPNLDGLRQYWFNEGRSADILHEYFIPRGREARFLDELRRVQRTVQEQTLNITVRDVAADLETALPYARENVSSFVLYYNEQLGAEGEARQAWLQSELIEAAAACGGTFYLPYQLHYSLDQLRRIHPGFSAFAAEKRRRDPEGIFTNCWWAKYGALDLAQPAGPSSP
jgi:FAD/FMN-containing dehydrogenase